MQATPLFLGACALASIAGVVSGGTVNTQPIQRAGIGMQEIARPAIEFDPADSGIGQAVALPDQYALSTPQGRIEVAELSSRGLYAQRRFGWRDAAYVPPPEPDYFSEPLPLAAEPDEVERPEPAVANPAIEPSIPQQEQPEGQARIIEVSEALAE